MNQFIPRTLCRLCLGLLLASFVAWTASGAGASISGTYEITEKTDVGSLVKVVVQFHLTNHEASAVSLQGMELSDFAYPHANGTQAAPVTLRPGATQDISREFVIPRAEYDQWKRGLRPRVILTLQTATGTKMNEALRLDRAAAGKGE